MWRVSRLWPIFIITFFTIYEGGKALKGNSAKFIISSFYFFEHFPYKQVQNERIEEGSYKSK